MSGQGSGQDEPRPPSHRARRWSRRRLLLAAAGVVTAAVVAAALIVVNGEGGDGEREPSSGLGTSAATDPPGTGAGPRPRQPSGTPPDVAEGDWPGPYDTGVPDGVTLTDYTGPSLIEQANTVIDGKLIRACLEIAAPGVVIRNSKLECDSMMVEVITWADPNASVTIEDSELDGLGTAAVIQDGNYTLRRVDIHNINEGPRIGDNVVIEDSWLHDLVFRSWEDHQDLLQTVGGTGALIRGNHLDARTDPVYFSNAVFQVGAEFGPTRDFLFEDNFVDGGGYAINIRDDPGMENLVFRDNVFGRHAEYGPATMGPNTVGVTWESSNVYVDTGEPVPL